MTITYQVKDAVYVNLTNRCPCNCTFCLRQNGASVFGSGPLWLEREPTLEETIDSLGQWDYGRFREVVFCGYGEPTERLDVLLAVAEYLKKQDPARRVRQEGQPVHRVRRTPVGGAGHPGKRRPRH